MTEQVITPPPSIGYHRVQLRAFGQTYEVSYRDGQPTTVSVRTDPSGRGYGGWRRIWPTGYRNKPISGRAAEVVAAVTNPPPLPTEEEKAAAAAKREAAQERERQASAARFRAAQAAQRIRDAAPDLYTALKAMIEHEAPQYASSERSEIAEPTWLRDARAAVAKAEGTTL